MLQGAISLTDDSSYLRDCFEDSQDIVFYSLQHLEALPDLIHSLLSNAGLSERIRQNAYQNAKEHHTWEKRIEALLT